MRSAVIAALLATIAAPAAAADAGWPGEVETAQGLGELPPVLTGTDRDAYLAVFADLKAGLWSDAATKIDALPSGPLKSYARAELFTEKGSPKVTDANALVALLGEAPWLPQAPQLAAMAQALRDRPLTAVTPADVASRAGVPRDRFFQHFPDVAACYLATYEASAALLRAETTTAVVEGTGRPYDERIALGVRAYLETLASEPGLARAFLRDVQDAGPEALRRRRAVNEGFAAIGHAFQSRSAGHRLLGADGHGSVSSGCRVRCVAA